MVREPLLTTSFSVVAWAIFGMGAAYAYTADSSSISITFVVSIGGAGLSIFCFDLGHAGCYSVNVWYSS